MSGRTEVASLFRALAPVLGRFGGRWYVFGAQAVMVWGRPRLTVDVDVTVHLAPEDPTMFVLAMRDAGFELRVRDVEDFVRRTRVLPFLHEASGLPLDVGRVRRRLRQIEKAIDQRDLVPSFEARLRRARRSH